MFSTEVERVWSRRVTGAVVVYALVRYVAVLDCGVLFLQTLVWNLGDKVRFRRHHDLCRLLMRPPQACSSFAHTDDVLGVMNYLAFSRASSRYSR